MLTSVLEHTSYEYIGKILGSEPYFNPRFLLYFLSVATFFFYCCRKYHCKAENPHGVAFHDIELEEAHEPGELQQAILDKSTATTLQFRYFS